MTQDILVIMQNEPIIYVEQIFGEPDQEDLNIGNIVIIQHSDGGFAARDCDDAPVLVKGHETFRQILEMVDQIATDTRLALGKK